MTTFWEGWIASEAAGRDVIRTKCVYVDINDGNLTDGVLFGRIVYWHLPDSKNNRPHRLTVQRDGSWWLAKRHDEWYAECRINERTARDCVGRIEARGLIETHIYHFGGRPTVHLRIVPEVLEARIKAVQAAPSASGKRRKTSIVNDEKRQLETPSKRQNPSNTNDRIRHLQMTFPVKCYISLVTALVTALSKDIAPTGAPDADSSPSEPSPSQIPSMPAESPAEEHTTAPGDLPDGYTLDASGRLYVRGDLFEDDEPITAYPCSAQDVNALIGAWWEWVPKRPTKRGAVIVARQHFGNTTNRDYAENLVKHGVTPGDFIECLGEIRVVKDHPRANLREQEMTFCYAAAVVEEWAAAGRAENIYTPACPRIVPRRPGVKVDLGELGGLSGPALFARFAEHPDLMVEVPRPYIGPHELQVEDDTDATDWSHEWTMEELEALCPL